MQMAVVSSPSRSVGGISLNCCPSSFFIPPLDGQCRQKVHAALHRSALINDVRSHLTFVPWTHDCEPSGPVLQ